MIERRIDLSGVVDADGFITVLRGATVGIVPHHGHGAGYLTCLAEDLGAVAQPLTLIFGGVEESTEPSFDQVLGILAHEAARSHGNLTVVFESTIPS